MSATKKNDYGEFLASRHAQFHTSEEIIRDVVRKGTSEEIRSKQKIIAGEASEVYAITLHSGKEVILRIGREGYPNFLQEQWAIERVKQMGVPVPDILLVQYIKDGDEERSLCLMEKSDGEPLERGSIDFFRLTQEEQKLYVVQSGEILSRIHSVKTDGYGVLLQEGKTKYASVDAYLNSRNAFISQHFYPIAAKEELGRQFVDRVIKIIDSSRDLYSRLKPCLNHGDFAPKHFLVRDGKIIAIVDWGEVRSDTPVSDFAYWEYWYSTSLPLVWLKEGYQNKALFDDVFEEMMHVVRIIKGLEIVGWYNMAQYENGLKMAIKKLVEDVAYFR